MRTPSGRVLASGIFRDDTPGVEVRVSYGEDDVLRSQRTRDLRLGRAIANEWRQTVLAKRGSPRSTRADDP